MPSPHDPSPTDSKTDAELADAAGRGDHAAFEALYFRYRDWTAALAYRFTGDRDTALDVLQETFAYLLRKLPSLRLTARLTTFLYPVVKHTALAARRKRRLGDAERVQEPVSEPAALLIPGEDYAGLREAVERLPEAQREVLLMRFVAEMSLAEIGTALGVPVGTVKSRLHHALRGVAACAPAAP